MSQEIEYRRLPPAEIEVREQRGKVTIGGYSPVYDSPSEDMGGAKEVVKFGAVTDCLKRGAEVRCYVNHERSMPLGSTTSGTLRLADTVRGLRWDCDLPDTSYARDMLASIDRGDIRHSSFGFRVAGPDGQSWSRDGQGGALRELRKIDLLDVSPVSEPAYRGSTCTIDVRSLDVLDDADFRFNPNHGADGKFASGVKTVTHAAGHAAIEHLKAESLHGLKGGVRAAVHAAARAGHALAGQHAAEAIAKAKQTGTNANKLKAIALAGAHHAITKHLAGERSISLEDEAMTFARRRLLELESSAPRLAWQDELFTLRSKLRLLELTASR